MPRGLPRQVLRPKVRSPVKSQRYLGCLRRLGTAGGGPSYRYNIRRRRRAVVVWSADKALANRAPTAYV
eukprot:4998639-Heterocapsa_arctica.AAC.1